jgi:hypothetical protein
MLIRMVSKKPHKFRGKIRKRGFRFEATYAEARALKALGRAVPEIEHVKEDQTYGRRDLEAAPIQAVAVIMVDEDFDREPDDPNAVDVPLSDRDPIE